MKNIKIVLIAALCLCASLPSFAQKADRQSYLDRYNLLVTKLGPAGVGVETLLQRWGDDFPEDVDMLLGKFSFYVSKSLTSNIEQIDSQKYLGVEPVLSLKDSLGQKVNYFQVVNYDDELFGLGMQAMDRAISLEQNRLDLRFYKVSALIGYEKDSPDMALSTLKSLIDYNCTTKPEWEYPGYEKVDEEFFNALVQENCFTFFKIATPGTFEAFKSISEQMLKYYPSNTLFQTNIGSYYLVCLHEDKKAQKIYDKVIKADPENYTAIKNCVLIARKAKNVKMEKKYLPMLIATSTDESEKKSAQMRLESL